MILTGTFEREGFELRPGRDLPVGGWNRFWRCAGPARRSQCRRCEQSSQERDAESRRTERNFHNRPNVDASTTATGRKRLIRKLPVATWEREPTLLYDQES